LYGNNGARRGESNLRLLRMLLWMRLMRLLQRLQQGSRLLRVNRLNRLRTMRLLLGLAGRMRYGVSGTLARVIHDELRDMRTLGT